MRPKVAIVTPGTFPIPHSITSSVERSIMQMAPFWAEKVNVDVIGRQVGNVAARIKSDGVNYTNVRASNRKHYLSNVISILRRKKPDVLQIENRPNYVAVFKKNFPKARTILTLHSLTFIQHDYIHPDKLRYAFNLADHIVVNSHFIKNEVEKLEPKTKGKLRVHYLGVDLQRFSPWYEDINRTIREADKKAHGLEGRRIVLFVGRLQPIKGVAPLIRAFQSIIRDFPDLMLVIVGSHSYGKAVLTEYVRRLHELAKPIQNQVQFINYIPSEEVARWYRMADVFVVPSIGPEAFGLVNLEAMATGLPLIASQIGGIPEIVEPSKSGILVSIDSLERNIEEKIRELLSNEDEALRLGQEARKFVEERFAWSVAADPYNRLYLEGSR
jgi:spore coat protein SA